MKSPFKFLDSYTKEDREIFFGREREIEELYHRVFESKIMLVFGVSGTGKSSLINCGLANKFQETDWLPLNIRRGGNMLESLATAIKSSSITPQTGEIITSAQFKKSVRSLYLDHYKPVFFIFDQFEELFIFGDKEERRSFVQIVKSLVESDLQCRLIFVMREEYMAGVTEFEKYIPSFFANRVRIEKMAHINAIEAIKGPCKVASIDLEEGFTEALLEKLNPGSADVELTYLQVFLDRILKLASVNSEAVNYVQKGHEVTFTLSLLSQVGSVSDLLGSFLDEQISLLEDPDTGLAILKSFVSVKGTKRPANETETIDNVRSLGKKISLEKATELLQTYVRLRVLRDKDDNGRYELRHDALAEKIFEKFSLAEKELLEIRQLIENAYQYYLKRKNLLSSDDLAYISNKDSLLNLNIELKGFLQESRRHQIAKKKTVRRLTVISALIFVLLMGILAYYISNNIDITNANYSAIKSLSQTRNLKNRLLLAADAWGRSQTVLPKEALLKAFNEMLNSETIDTSIKINRARFKPVFEPAPSKIQYAACSADNKYIYGYSDSLIILWETTGKLYRTIRSANQIIDIKMSGNSKLLGVVNKDSLLLVYDISGNQVFKYKIRYNILNTKQIFRFLKEDNILVLSAEHDAVLLNHEGMILQTFDRHTDKVNAVNISNDNNFIATASSDKTIIIWYMNSVKKKYDYYNTLTWHTDTVWSVSFSSANIFVLSASADSTIRVGTLNNEVIGNNNFNFFPKDKKYCYAEFTASSRGIVTQSYEYPYEESRNLFLGSHADNPTCRQSAFTTLRLHGSEGTIFSYFVFSPYENYFIYQQNNKTYLADTRLVFASDNSSISNLLKIIGSKQFFTTDEKFILSVCGNTFKTYFIDLNDILEVLREKK